MKLKDNYILSTSLAKTAQEIVYLLKKNSIVALSGTAGSGKTALCKYMIKQNMFNCVAENVKYFYCWPKNLLDRESYCLEDKDENDVYNTLFIFDCVGTLKDKTDFINVLSKTKRLLSENNKMLLILGPIDIELPFEYKLVNMPTLGYEEMRNIAISIASNLEMNLSKAELKLILNLAKGSITNLCIILKIYSDKSFQKVFENISNMRDIQIETSTWFILALLVGIRAEEEGKFEVAKQIFLSVYEKLHDKDHDQKARVLSLLANLAVEQKKYLEAIQCYEQLISEEKNTEALVANYNAISEVFRYEGQYSKAEEYLGKSLSLIALDCYEDENLMNLEVSTLINLGAIYRETGRYSEAIATYQKCIELSRNNYNGLALINNNLAAIYVVIKDYCSAISFYQKAILFMEQAKQKSPVQDSEYLRKSDYVKLENAIKSGLDFCMRKLRIVNN